MAMRIEDLMKRNPECAHENENIQQAAKRMRDQNIGFLPVCDQSMRPIGTLTDRDITIRAVANDNRPSETRVGEVMTQCPVSVHEETPLEEALREMRRGPFRRVPVVDRAGKLVGLLSLDDILDLLAEEFGQIRELLSRESPAGLA